MTDSLELGMVGLGRMGANIVRRVVRHGHRCVVQDVSAAAVAAVVGPQVRGAGTLAELTSMLERPRTVWLMLPAALTQGVLDQLVELLEPDDVVIDGGNSFYGDDITRAAALRARGLHYVDCGTSGGVWGLERGYALMIGGESEVVTRLDPLFAAIAPGATGEPTAGRENRATTADRGYLHCGPSGAGHFVKMVHNGVEYGMMAAIAEGLNILRHANVGNHPPSADAETAPIPHPELFRYEIDVAEVAEVWRHGSVVSSWLVDLVAAALARSGDLSEFAGRVSDSGEGRWTVNAAVDIGVPAPTLATALFARFESRGEGEFAAQLLSAMRAGFGGHAERPRS